MTAPRRDLRLLAALALLAYPPAFRRRFGADMRRDFLARPSYSDALRLVLSGIGERFTAARRWISGRSSAGGEAPSSGAGALDAVRTDVAGAIRSAARAPLFSGLSIAALALGIGVNTAIFSTAYGVLKRPLPYADPGRLIALWSDDTNANKPRSPISPADFADFRSGAADLVSLESYFSFVTNGNLSIDGRSENVRTAFVSPGLLPLLGRAAATGRVPDVQERDAAVLSDGFWRRRFGGARSVVGRRFTVDDTLLTVTGVMPADFVFPYKGMLGPTGFTESIDVDLWIPVPPTDSRFVDASGQPSRSTRFLGALGRLRPGATASRVASRLTRIAAVLEHDHPQSNRGWRTSVVDVGDEIVSGIRPALLLLAVAAAMIFLMACLNVANLALARALARRGDLAVRIALGASPRRLVRQALAQSFVLAAGGAAAGVLVAYWGVRGIVAFAPPDTPRLPELRPDSVILAAAVAASIVATVLVGVAPAFLARRTQCLNALHEGGRGSVGSLMNRRLGSGLVIVQVALALVLAIAASLLVRSFARLMAVDPGFRLEHVLTAQMNIPERLTTPESRDAFYAVLFERIRALPGVISAGATTRIPLGSTNVSTTLAIEGRDVPPGERPSVEFRRALYDYFGTMGIPLLRGRVFSADEGLGTPPVAIVNQTLAQQLFRNVDPVGQRVRFGTGAGPWTTIVGVVGDVRHSRIESDPDPEVYVNAIQNPPVAPFIAIRTSGDAAELAESLRSTVLAVDPTLTLFDIRTMEDIHSASLAGHRFVLLIVGSFGMLALVLAGVGVYGVMSLVAVDRMREAGVRLALGAQPISVLALILKHAIALSSAGIAAGLGVAAAVVPLLRTQLFGVDPTDPLTFASAPVVLLLVCAAAAFVPAWRAMRVDPATVLHAQ